MKLQEGEIEEKQNVREIGRRRRRRRRREREREREREWGKWEETKWGGDGRKEEKEN